MRFIAALIASLSVSPAIAQTPATIAVYSLAASNPNTAAPVATPVSYTSDCSATKWTEQAPITNPNEGYFDNPDNASTDCFIDIAAQFSGLPDGTYKAAVKVGNNPYGPFSTEFAMLAAQVAHPCDGAAPTSGTVVAGTRVLSWCYPDNATGGSPITGWRITSGATVTTVAVSSVTVGSSANSAGRRLYSTQMTIPVGSTALRVAPINSVGPGQSSNIYTVTGTSPVTAPTGSTDIRGVN